MKAEGLDPRVMRRYSMALTPQGRLWLLLHAQFECVLWRCALASGTMTKRGLDIVLSALALIILSPLFLLIAILIKLEDRGPIFFTQTRVGQFGREFKMFKFRSMCLD